jgi:hypothetical protein
MGNSFCESKKKDVREDFSVRELENSVFIGDVERLKKDLFSLKNCGIDFKRKIITYGSYLVSPPVFAFLIGNLKSFDYFIDECGLFKEFNSELQELKIDPFYYICGEGFTEILIFLLPRFTSLNQTEESFNLSHTLSFEGSKEKSQKKTNTPIQKACENGHVSIVVALNNYFKGKSFTPYIFDIEKPDENKGETCALIACRQGDIAMIRALHKICKADFTKLNWCHENALIICLSGYKKMKTQEFFECFEYLVQVVQIDLSYKFEELLLLAEGLFVEIVEKKLKNIGIQVTKDELENGFKIQVVVCRREKRADEGLDCGLLAEKLEHSRESTIVCDQGVNNFRSFVSDLKEVLEY